MTPMQEIKVLYDMHKKGFIDMVKGLIALVFEVFNSFLFLSNYFLKYGIYSSQKKWRENKAIAKQKNKVLKKMSTYF